MNHRTTYHRPTQTAIVGSILLPGIEGPGFTLEPISVTKYILLIVHPIWYIKTMWMEKTRGESHLQSFIVNAYYPTQASFLTNPATVIRAEYLKGDLAELGIEGTMDLPLPPRKSVCARYRTALRRNVGIDYVLGDYE